MIRASSVRYFLTVSPCPVWMHIAFAVAVIAGIATLWLNPAEVDSAFGTILLLQMFAASNGYATAAALGHYDPLLVSGRSRSRIALANLCAAVLPGVAAWLAIVIVASVLGRADLALAPHRQAALLIVSAGAWTAGLALPRMAAGALWSAVLVTIALSRSFTHYLPLVQTIPSGPDRATAAAAFAVCPYLLLGEFAAARSLGVLVLDALLVVFVVCVGVWYIARREYALVEPA